MDAMQVTQFLNKYARYDWTKARREGWAETVQRTVDYLVKVGGKPVEEVRDSLYEQIFNQNVSPSMRLMATAGEAADQNQVSIYNCSYLPLQAPADFGDLTILLGHGVGVGFSVENEFVGRWQIVTPQNGTTVHFTIDDSIEGWAFSFKTAIELLISGFNVEFDYTNIRPAGAPLKTRGGHASGPAPLKEAHERIATLIKSRPGEWLTSVDLFDIACHIAQCIVSGGVRRSAMIAIFDWDDEAMKKAKSGEWWRNNLQRQNANISAVVDRWMDEEEWFDYVKLMDENKSGEPGIWSRYAIRSSLPERRKYVRWMGPNPLDLAA